MDNSATIELKRADLYAFIESIGKKLDILELEDS